MSRILIILNLTYSAISFFGFRSCICGYLETRYQNMLKSYKSSLQLNSYKLDSQSYEHKLQELGQENQELKSTIYELRLREHTLSQELNDFKQQIQALRVKLTKQQPIILQQEPSVCQKCSQKQHLLDREREKANQYKEMYENQLQNKKDTTQYYQSKLHSLLRDKDVLVNKYEQKIKSMTQPSIPVPSRNGDSATSLGKSLNDLPRSPDHKSNRKLPPTPQKSQVRQSPNFKKDNTIPQQPMNSLIKGCLKHIQKMNLSLNELKYIQQIDHFSQVGVVDKNRYTKLMREFPFEYENEDHIQKSFEEVITALRQQGQEETGKNIMSFILKKMAELM